MDNICWYAARRDARVALLSVKRRVVAVGVEVLVEAREIQPGRKLLGQPVGAVERAAWVERALLPLCPRARAEQRAQHQERGG
eukprot:scaffold118901_cov43-Tisochrysis_lutea.AAC.1